MSGRCSQGQTQGCADAASTRLQRKHHHSLSIFVQRPEPDPNIGPQHPPEEVDSLGPRALSFWISSLFHDSQLRQQSLLEVPALHCWKSCICTCGMRHPQGVFGQSHDMVEHCS